jgi:hypothetical protein
MDPLTVLCILPTVTNGLLHSPFQLHRLAAR